MAQQNIALTADSVIFYREEGKTEVLLVKRKNDPYKGRWALPGGFLEDEEPLETGAQRELEEETGLKVENLQQIRAYGKPDRDPRGRTVSVGFWGELKSKAKVKGNDDAAVADWFNIDELPELAFDHDEVLEDALKKLNSRE